LRWPPLAPARAKQHDACGGSRAMSAFPFLDVLHRDAVLFLSFGGLGHVDHYSLRNQPLQWNLRNRPSPRIKMQWRIDVCTEMFRDLQFAGEQAVALVIANHLGLNWSRGAAL